ncbi:MAG TPA: hypothetical protein VGG03_16305 [Thermoanaerobaculia bacterium]|jgi:ABC-type sulfate transport system permease component
MKKLSVHLALLCLLVLLLIPFAGCKKEETEVEETPATTTDTTMETTTETTMGTTTDMGMSTDMGTDMTTSEPMGTDMSTPPSGQ